VKAQEDWFYITCSLFFCRFLRHEFGLFGSWICPSRFRSSGYLNLLKTPTCGLAHRHTMLNLHSKSSDAFSASYSMKCISFFDILRIFSFSKIHPNQHLVIWGSIQINFLFISDPFDSSTGKWREDVRWFDREHVH